MINQHDPGLISDDKAFNGSVHGDEFDRVKVRHMLIAGALFLWLFWWATGSFPHG